MTGPVGSEQPRGRLSTRYRVLVVLGWLCIGATVAVVGFGLVWLLSSLWIMFDAFGVLILVLQAFTLATFGLAIGFAFLMGARACRVDAKARRFKLWARLLLLATAELSLVFPFHCYFTITYMQILGRGYVDALDHAVLGATAQASTIPFLIGIIALAVALIWGRRKSERDIPAVFS